MKTSGLFRLGRDAELHFLPKGDAVINLALACSYGKKGEDGNRPTQWLEGAMFGKRAETLAPYLLKGNQVVVHLSDIHIETYEGKNGTSTKLVGRIDDVELTDRKDGQTAPQQRQATPSQAPAQRQGASSQQRPAQRQAPNQQGSGFDDMSEDIPF